MQKQIKCPSCNQGLKDYKRLLFECRNIACKLAGRLVPTLQNGDINPQWLKQKRAVGLLSGGSE